MWFLTEIGIKTKTPIRIINDICKDKKYKIGFWTGSDGRYLGEGMSDNNGNELIKILEESKECSE